MTDANSYQISGDHYKDTQAVQHWDLIEDNGLGYLEGYATKYLDRCGIKEGIDPVEDVRKARHITSKLLEKHNAGRQPRGCVPLPALNAYLASRFRNRPPELRAATFSLCTWRTGSDLSRVLRVLDQLILSYKTKRATHVDNTGQRQPFGYDHASEEGR
jgi:hypothetical protein